ncbi:MAG: DUF502 domain-containing protein [Burkholderiales bacterium]|jgi:uncharacterized membrane protein|nr:DUF502 domain-containing protein [Burkholderiales bacterium]
MRKYFITGLLIWVPLGITLWVLHAILGTLDRTLDLLPGAWHPDRLLGFHLPGFGLLLTLLIVLVTGVLAANFIGARLLRWWENLLSRIPIVRSIYSSVKQVSDTMLSPKGNAFRKAALVEFPRRGQWAIGLVVGSPGAAIEQVLGANVVTVFVPTAPNPTSGYTVIVPPSELKECDMSVDDALRFIVSLGVVTPSGSRSRAAVLTSDSAAASSQAAVS